MSGQIPIKFNAELSRPANPVFPVYKGESFFIRAVLTDHGQPFSATLSAPKLYYQTADMENTWWSLDATQEGNVISVDFPASAIPARDRLNCFLGSAGENFHAAFTMDFRHSPGATPNEVELPLSVLDFEKIEVLNAPYYTKEEANDAFQPKGDYKTRQTAVADPRAGDTPANAFISGIAQNENGEIAPVKSPLPSFQAPLTFDNTPTEGSSNPVTSDGIKKAIDAVTPSDYDAVKQQVQQNTTDIGTNTNAIAGIDAKIPAQASAQNQLADKEFVNSSIATNTATFRGTYNLVTDLSLTTSATHEQVAAAIKAKLAALSITPENNDYCFVQVPRTDAEPTIIDRIDRYKCTVEDGVSSWDYEWSLNNSSFTAAQWAAINSGITSALVAKLGALPTAEQLAAQLLAKYEKPATGIPKTDLSAGVQASLDKADTALQSAPVTSVNNKTGAVTLSASDVGALGNTGDQTLDGTLTLRATRIEQNKIVYDVGAAGESKLIFPAGKNDYLAVLSDIYAAIQQIAPDFSWKAYALNELCTYDGAVYWCKSAYTATALSPTPNIDTTHWEVKKVSELFLPLTGGTITGDVEIIRSGSSSSVAHLTLADRSAINLGDPEYGVELSVLNNIGSRLMLWGNGISEYRPNKITFQPSYGGSKYDLAFPSASGTLALLENIAPAFSTSATYEVNKLCVYANALYRCTTAITTAGAWDSSKWTAATVQDVLAAIEGAMAGMATKVSGATSGNLAALDANGNLADSGKSAARVDDDAETAAFADIFRMDTELNVVANATPQDVAVAKLTELMGESLDAIYAAAQAA